jgi:hypothetical protein
VGGSCRLAFQCSANTYVHWSRPLLSIPATGSELRGRGPDQTWFALQLSVLDYQGFRPSPGESWIIQYIGRDGLRRRLRAKCPSDVTDSRRNKRVGQAGHPCSGYPARATGPWSSLFRQQVCLRRDRLKTGAVFGERRVDGRRHLTCDFGTLIFERPAGGESTGTTRNSPPPT